ncbi:MAG: MATE family efflux transporter [Clostridiales bacterium]|nr:MATE family efflux transporter [Clostridiales bacterium]
MIRTKDMTSGNPVKLILVFALPILAGNTLQQLYSLVDSLIIGRMLGVTALTAVSASGWLDWAVLSVPMGLAQGYSIHAAQCYGGRRFADLKRSVAQSYLISAVAILFLETASQLLLHPVLVWMNSPDETIGMTENYLRIIYAGLPIVMCLNLFSGFLHALGNSRVPLIALACSTTVNIILDWWFVGSLGMGTNGGAFATVIAQAVSAAICFAEVLRIPELKPDRADFRPDGKVIRKLVRLGFSIAFQNLIISLGGLVLQGVVNAFGFIFMAGYNAAARFQGLIEIAGTALGNAAGTFTGQNFGAGRMDRVKTGLRRAAQIGFLLAVTVGLIMVCFGKPLLSLFIREEAGVSDRVLAFGYDFLRIMAAGLPMLYLLFIYRTTLQGLGDTMVPMLSGFVELALRIASALLLPLAIGYWGVYLAEITAWIGAGIFLIIGYYRRLKRIAQPAA